MKVFSLLEFVIQSIVATMGAFVLGAIGARLLSIVVGLLTRNSGPVNVVDYPVDQQVFRGWLTVRIFWLPSLPPSCLASSRIAYGKRMRVSRFGCFRLCFWSGTYFHGNRPQTDPIWPMRGQTTSDQIATGPNAFMKSL
jgi:hypothetical protein